MTWTLCTSGAAIHEAGANVNSTIITSGAALANYSDEAEAVVIGYCRYDVVGQYSNLTTSGKLILQNMAACLIGQKIIKYDMSGYTTRAEATQMLNVLENEIKRGIALVTTEKTRTYLGIVSGN